MKKKKNCRTEENKWSSLNFGMGCLGCVSMTDCRTDKEKAEDYEEVLEKMKNEEDKKWFDYKHRLFEVKCPPKLYDKLVWEAKHHYLDYDVYQQRLQNLFTRMWNELDKKYGNDEYYKVTDLAHRNINMVEMQILKDGIEVLEKIEAYTGDLF